MAVQLYGEAYSLSYWKARHILWWSAIEATLRKQRRCSDGRIYSFFGNKNLVDGYNCPIYEKGDIPSCFTAFVREPSHARENGAADLRGSQRICTWTEGS